MAVGISCAGTANKEALDLLTPMLEDQVDFVRQGALVSAAYCLLLYMNHPFQYFFSPSFLLYFLISHTQPSISSYLNPTTSSSLSFSPSFTSSFFLSDFPRSGDAANSRGTQSIREEVPRPPHCRHRWQAPTHHHQIRWVHNYIPLLSSPLTITHHPHFPSSHLHVTSQHFYFVLFQRRYFGSWYIGCGREERCCEHAVQSRLLENGVSGSSWYEAHAAHRISIHSIHCTK